MIQLYDKHLSEQEVAQLAEEYGDINVGTVVYTEDGALPLIISEADGISIGEMEITESRI